MSNSFLEIAQFPGMEESAVPHLNANSDASSPLFALVFTFQFLRVAKFDFLVILQVWDFLPLTADHFFRIFDMPPRVERIHTFCFGVVWVSAGSGISRKRNGIVWFSKSIVRQYPTCSENRKKMQMEKEMKMEKKMASLWEPRRR